MRQRAKQESQTCTVNLNRPVTCKEIETAVKKKKTPHMYSGIYRQTDIYTCKLNSTYFNVIKCEEYVLFLKKKKFPPGN